MKREDAGDQDAIWQQIVDNYGERVLTDAPEEPAGSADVRVEREHADAERTDEVHDLEHPVEADRADQVDRAGGADRADDIDPGDEVDPFVPEEAPPVALPSPDRLLAWAGVLGSPVVLLGFLLLGLGLPSLLLWVLVGGFIAGFCYLVARMPKEPRDPWDDGARV